MLRLVIVKGKEKKKKRKKACSIGNGTVVEQAVTKKILS